MTPAVSKSYFPLTRCWTNCDAITTRELSLTVLDAARFPMKSGDWESDELGTSAFLHKDVREGWWEEYTAQRQSKIPSCAVLGGVQHGLTYMD